jgi:hypothetical protein
MPVDPIDEMRPSAADNIAATTIGASLAA